MNPDSPQTPREELEARLTALLLGELSAEEAAALRVQLAQDPELAALHKRLKQTIGLVREVSVRQSEPATAQAAPLTLSEERREQLLAEFKTIKAQPLLPPLPRRQRWLVPVAAAAILLLLAAITLPNFIRARNTSASNAMMNNLRQIEAAKQQWAVDHNKLANAVPTMEDLKPYMKGGELPASVAGETYVLGPVGLPPTVESAKATPRTWFFGRSASTPQQVTRLAKELDPVSKRLDEAISSAIRPKPVPPPQPERARGDQLSERYDNTVTYRNQIVLPTPTEPEAEVSARAVHDASEFGLQFRTWGSGGRPSSVAEGRKAGAAVVAQSVSDPEWAGALERPALPHSTDDRFVTRYDHTEDRGASPTTGLPLPAAGILPEVAAEGKAAAGIPLAFADSDSERRLGLSPSVGRPAAGTMAGEFQNRYGLPAAPAQGVVRGRLAESVESKVAPLPALAPPPSPREITAGIAGAAPADPTVESVSAPPGYAAFGELSVGRKPVAKPEADKVPVLGDLPAVGGALQMERPTAEARPRGFSLLGPVAPAAQPEPQVAATERYAFDTLGRTAPQSPATGRVPASSPQPVPRVNVAGAASLPIPGSPTPQVIYSTNVVGYTVVPLESSPVALEAAKQPLGRSQSSIVLPPTSAGAGVVNAGVARAGDALQDARISMEFGRPADAEVKLREVLQREPDNRAAGYYLNLAREQQLANARKLGEHESKKGVVQTALLRQELESLRLGLAVSETDAAGATPAPMLETGALRNIEAARVESAARYLREQKQLDQLRAYNKEQLMEALPQIVPGAGLSEQRVQLGRAEQRLVEVEKVYGQEHPEGKRAKAQVDELRRRTDDLAVSVMSNLESQVAIAKGEADSWANVVEEAKELDREKADKSRAYFDKKRELAEAERFQQLLAEKNASEGIDQTLPKDTGVVIVDRAEATPSDGQGLWSRLRRGLSRESDAVARIKIEPGASEISGLSLSARQSPDQHVYDPYFIQTEFEAIQSEAVLGKVVNGLKLDEAWAEKRGGESLKTEEAIAMLKQQLDLRPARDTGVVEIRAKSDKPEEAARIANAVAEAYRDYRSAQGRELAARNVSALQDRLGEQEQRILQTKAELERLGRQASVDADIAPSRKPATNAPIPQPEIQTTENAFSTFSLNVSDVAFKLAAASLEQGQMPDAASVRAEEFINAFDYRDPEPPPGVPVAFAWERARYPFAHNRDLLRFSLKTGAAGRQAGRPLNLVLLLDNSGSMERADRVQIIREALRVLAGQLQPQDKLSVITFARSARLVADGRSGDQAGEVLDQVSGLAPQGGTNLEEAMNLAYATALRHYLAHGLNRVVLLTDGAANLGNVEPESLKHAVETHRKQGVALDCFGIGWEGFNDDLLEVLSRNGDGRYGFLNSPEDAATDFAGQLAGALQVAASDVKVQVEFNPRRVTAYRQIGYAKHQLTKEQFRDNTVDAAEIAAQEAGNALYTVAVNPAGEGPLCIVRCRFKIPGTTDYREHEWAVPYTGNAATLEQASPAMRLAASASAFAEWLVVSPFAAEVTPDALLGYLNGVPEVYGADARPKKLEWMIRQAKSLAGR
ncbi:MAG: von Willebrand factor type A domain-containing protein [Verrucomicrobiae bacterium]|nr:von Willebrand factor type A domain-containing protein [Verrucomicrobiae bacterium]